MSAARFEARLAAVLERWLDRNGGVVSTFEAEMIAPRHRGLVLTLANGQEFLLTITESTRSWQQ